MKVEIRYNKTLVAYDVTPLEGAMQGKRAATVEAIVMDNVQLDGGRTRGDVVAIWGAILTPGIDDDTAVGLAAGRPWPEPDTGSLQEFYAVDAELAQPCA